MFYLYCRVSVVSFLKLAGLFLADASLRVPRARVLPAVVLLLLIGCRDLALYGGGGTGGRGGACAAALGPGLQPLALLAVPHAVPKIDDEAWETKDDVEGGGIH